MIPARSAAAHAPASRERKTHRSSSGATLARIQRRVLACLLAGYFGALGAPTSEGYTFNMIVPDVRQPVLLSGGSACPVRSRLAPSAGSIAFRWSITLSTNPTTILTKDQSPSGRLNEIEQAIQQSLSAWANVNGTTLKPNTIAPVARTNAANSCGADGLNSICFDQPDMAFTPGVLAFTRVVTADRAGEQMGSGAVSSFPGQILDADIYFNPSDADSTFATPTALAANASAYDLESILTHELGHALGFSHSAVWSAMMYPFAPAPGTFTGARPTTQQPDAPLSDDDRTGLRVLYPDPADTTHFGTIRGRVLPANPLSLANSPPGTTGVFGTYVVAVDQETGAVAAATIGGWSCADPGPAQFDGSYALERLALGRSYFVYAEPLNGVVAPSQLGNALTTLCRNATTDAGWPPTQACVVPTANTSFTARSLPAP